ncbi:demethoxyubiquinone hydroxylase family protein, partial [Vineibacter terrae]
MSEEARPSDSGPEPAPVVLARTNEGWQPGDPTPRAFVERVIRVDQAGEFGAVRIYEGQLAALRWRGQGNSPAARKIEHMLAQEVEHRRAFDALLADRRVRPTALSPVWSVAGFALGAATALLGDAAAMACTVAVEEAIDEHYASQRDRLGDDVRRPAQGAADRHRLSAGMANLAGGGGPAGAEAAALAGVRFD